MDQQQQRNETVYCCKVWGRQYGIRIKYIENIIVMQNITRVPKAQSYFKGVINLRGDVVPVMSLRKSWGKMMMSSHYRTESSW